MRWVAVFLVFCSTIFSWTFQDKTVDHFAFEWNHPEDFQEAAFLFVDSFLVAYQGFTPQELGVTSIEGFLKEVIEEELLLKESNPEMIHWLIAKKDNVVVGLLILELSQYPEVYCRQMAISPYHMRSGIGKILAGIALESLPECNRFVAITRVLNQASARFFESIGMQRVEYMYEGYDPNKYVGYEYIP